MTIHTVSSHARYSVAAILTAVLIFGVVSLANAASGARPAPLPQPTEAQMGAPAFPGATYDGQMSAGLSQGESYYWVFATSDPVAKVVAFYKQKTGLVPLEIEGNYQFTITKGKNPYFPDAGFTIEPNKMFVGGPKTAITFIKKK